MDASKLSDEEMLRNSTISSLKKITPNLYTLNYQNNYYLDEIINKGVKNQNEVKSFCTQKFGINFNFDEKQSDKVNSCSSFNVYNKKNQNLMGRNFDYPKLSPTLVVWTHPSNGYKSISFVDGEYIGIFEDQEIIKERLLYTVYDIIDGINEKGLALSILRLANTPSVHQDDSSKKNITSSIMMKGVLDYCKNVDEAVDYFKKYNLHELYDRNSSLHYLIVDSKGDSVILEYIDNKMIVIKPYEIEKVKYLYLTNFFLKKEIGNGNNNGLDRYQILKEKLKDDTIMEEDKAMNLLNDVHKSTTIWSNVYNTNELTVITALRQNYTIFYKFDVNKPNECIISKNDNSIFI